MTKWTNCGRFGSVLALACPLSLGGCVSVEAPTEPIVIELNINIQQEVVYRLDSDAQELIKKEAEIF
ncbi:YnbE family lipoprotein [Novosphingopyxis sp.]|uniref:YnbE family lipoprotein n=1 Tax=Novosphingopyxis sp. TaxID=2709690 RepID=UPI003B5B3319